MRLCTKVSVGRWSSMSLCPGRGSIKASSFLASRSGRPAVRPRSHDSARDGVEATKFGLQRTEPATLQVVAANLLSFCQDEGLGEDEGCRVWADRVQGLEHAPKLDPIVGAVSGIGPALFAYMRMRCGADALKPDLRVARALRDLGFHAPGDGIRFW